MSYGWRLEDGIIAEVCDECGFDSRRVRDLAGALRSLHVVAECAAEVREAAGLTAVPDPADAAGAIAAVDAVLGELTGHGLDEVTLEAPFAVLTAGGNLMHALHDAEHHVLDIRRGYAGFALARGDDLHTTRR